MFFILNNNKLIKYLKNQTFPPDYMKVVNKKYILVILALLLF